MLLKILILLLISIFGVYNDNFLNKFHQSDYIVKFTRLELVRYNKDMLNSVSIRTFKHNRTTAAFNVTWNAKIDFGNKVDFVMRGKKFYSNEYRRTPVAFQLNFCQIINNNIFGLGSVDSCGNLTTCTLVKNVTYHVCNFVPDGAHMPPLIPNGQYRVDIDGLYNDNEIAFIYAFLEIGRLVPIPKG